MDEVNGVGHCVGMAFNVGCCSRDANLHVWPLAPWVRFKFGVMGVSAAFALDALTIGQAGREALVRADDSMQANV